VLSSKPPAPRRSCASTLHHSPPQRPVICSAHRVTFAGSITPALMPGTSADRCTSAAPPPRTMPSSLRFATRRPPLRLLRPLSPRLPRSPLSSPRSKPHPKQPRSHEFILPVTERCKVRIVLRPRNWSSRGNRVHRNETHCADDTTSPLADFTTTSSLWLSDPSDNVDDSNSISKPSSPTFSF
jgi:hypothetical protein